MGQLFFARNSRCQSALKWIRTFNAYPDNVSKNLPEQWDQWAASFEKYAQAEADREEYLHPNGDFVAGHQLQSQSAFERRQRCSKIGQLLVESPCAETAEINDFYCQLFWSLTSAVKHTFHKDMLAIAVSLQGRQLEQWTKQCSYVCTFFHLRNHGSASSEYDKLYSSCNALSKHLVKL